MSHCNRASQLNAWRPIVTFHWFPHLWESQVQISVRKPTILWRFPRSSSVLWRKCRGNQFHHACIIWRGVSADGPGSILRVVYSVGMLINCQVQILGFHCVTWIKRLTLYLHVMCKIIRWNARSFFLIPIANPGYSHEVILCSLASRSDVSILLLLLTRLHIKSKSCQCVRVRV
jgi:hypothetical protein